MAINKVVYGGNTLVDLTGDSVTSETLAAGRTATAANGEKIVGLMPTITEEYLQNVVNTAQNASEKVDDLEERMDSGEFKGEDGYTPIKGVDYFDGSNGKDGSDGVSCTHSWNGTTLTVTSASGSSSANLKGDKGDKGDTGAGIIPVTATSSDGITYTATVPYITATNIANIKGIPIVIIPNKESVSASSVALNVNGLGAKSVKRGDNVNSSEWWSFTSASWLKAGYPIQVMFNGSYFMIQSMQKPYASDLNGTVSIEKGGTGATTAAAALANLGGVTEARVQEMINAIAVYNGSVT